MERKCLKNSSTWKTHTNSLCVVSEQRNWTKPALMQKKSAYTHVVVVLAWKLSSFQQLPTEKTGILLKNAKKCIQKWGAHPRRTFAFLLQPQHSGSTFPLEPTQLPLPLPLQLSPCPALGMQELPQACRICQDVPWPWRICQDLPWACRSCPGHGGSAHCFLPGQQSPVPLGRGSGLVPVPDSGSHGKEKQPGTGGAQGTEGQPSPAPALNAVVEKAKAEFQPQTLPSAHSGQGSWAAISSTPTDPVPVDLGFLQSRDVLLSNPQHMNCPEGVGFCQHSFHTSATSPLNFRTLDIVAWCQSQALPHHKQLYFGNFSTMCFKPRESDNNKWKVVSRKSCFIQILSQSVARSCYNSPENREYLG